MPITPESISRFRGALAGMGVKPGSAPDPKPHRGRMLRSSSRATTIVGLMLQALEQEKQSGTAAGSLVVRAGRILWGLVEIGTPHSTPRLVMRYWFSLLMLFEIVIILGAAILSSAAAQSFGIKLLVVTIVVRLAAELIWLFLNRSKWIVPVAVAIAAGLIVALGSHAIHTALDTGRTVGWAAYFAQVRVTDDQILWKSVACVLVLLVGVGIQWLFTSRK